MGMYDNILVSSKDLPFADDKMKERIRTLDTFQTYGYNDMLDTFTVDPNYGLFYHSEIKSIEGDKYIMSPIDEDASLRLFEESKKKDRQVIPYSGELGFGGCDLYGTSEIIGFIAHYKDGKLTKIVNTIDQSEINYEK